MPGWTRGILVFLLLLLPSSVKGEREPDKLNLGSARDTLTLLTDGFGHYFAVEDEGRSSVFYYGDAKVLYRQHVQSFSVFDETSSHFFWAPNAATERSLGGELTRNKDTGWGVQCSAARAPLQELSGEERGKLLEKVEFRARKWMRAIRFAARDEDGNYYIVDSENEGYSKAWRLFIGKRGKLKQMQLVDVVSDSGGDVFATKRGDLSFERRGKRRAAIWSRGDKSEELTFVPPSLNAKLFYSEMGIYPQGLGTPCDHF